MSAQTGQPLGGRAHLEQSVRDILLTPIGSRVMRRGYGSEFYELQDEPLHEATVLRYYAATAKALRLWEPRLRLMRVQAIHDTPGTLGLQIYGVDLQTGDEVVLLILPVR